MTETDFTISGGGTIYLVHPRNDELRAALAERVPDDAQWLGSALAVEHRYIADLVAGLREEGFSVS